MKTKTRSNSGSSPTIISIVLIAVAICVWSVLQMKREVSTPRLNAKMPSQRPAQTINGATTNGATTRPMTNQQREQVALKSFIERELDSRLPESAYALPAYYSVESITVVDGWATASAHLRSKTTGDYLPTDASPFVLVRKGEDGVWRVLQPHQSSFNQAVWDAPDSLISEPDKRVFLSSPWRNP